MNNIFKQFIGSILMIALLASCHSVEKVVVSGAPGTKIYTPDKTEVATIAPNGQAKIKLPGDAYFGYLYTYDAAYDKYVPFALDVVENKHSGCKIALGTSFAVDGIGLSAMVVGLAWILATAEDEEANTTPAALAVGGGGVLALGSVLGGMAASSRMGELNHQYNFGYAKKQETNQNVVLAEYVAPYASVATQTAKANEKETPAIDTPTEATTSRHTLPSSKSTRTIKDSAKRVEGTYSVSGKLTIGNETVEELSGNIILITKTGKNEVKVEIYDGKEKFFSSTELYSVAKGKNGSITLTHKKISSAHITITPSGKITYTHPRVNIEGDNYTLTLSGSKAASKSNK